MPPLRRLGLAAALVVLVVVVASSIVARAQEDRRAVAPPAAPPGQPAREVSAVLPADGTVRARVGDIVDITVETADEDTALIDSLGESVETSKAVPGVFELVAYRTGTFPVTMQDTGKTVGRLIVGPAPPR